MKISNTSTIQPIATGLMPVFNRDGGATVDIGAYELATIWYVDANAPAGGDGRSWGSAFKYLNDALNEPCPAAGGQIWVAEGTYYPDETADFTDGTGVRRVSFDMKNCAKVLFFTCR